VAEYLSDAWVDALDDALQASSSVAAVAPLVIEQVVRDVPGHGEVRYRVWIDVRGGHAGRIGAADEHDTPPDIRLSTDFGTATAIASGRENAQTALARGRLQLGGSVDVLTRHADALAALDDATAELRGTTTYGAGADESP
jgi:SCP-2 sterol transfer family protein